MLGYFCNILNVYCRAREKRGDFLSKILLVDDDDTYTWCMAKFLKLRGYGVDIAATVADAKQILKREVPLFISSDLDLPDGSGLELLDMVCATSTDIPFLVVSCHEKEEYEKAHCGVVQASVWIK